MCDLTTWDDNRSGDRVAATGNAVRRLTQALRCLNPRRKTGSWTILCDGEAFLRAKDSLAAYRSKKIVLWAVPAKSPDLNPVEMLSKPGRITIF